MTKHVYFAICLFGLLHSGALKGADVVTWEAVVENGDKPGNVYVLQVEGTKLSGFFYLTDPNHPKDLDNGRQFKMEVEARKGNDLLATFEVTDGVGKKYPAKIVIHLDSEFKGDAVTASLWNGERTRKERDLVFNRRNK